MIVCPPTWSRWEIRYKFIHWPRRWTYRGGPLKYPRDILLRGSGNVLGRVSRELDEDGRVGYRICGTDLVFELLLGAGDALYARHCLEKK